MRPGRLLAAIGVLAGVSGLLLDFYVIAGDAMVVSATNPVARSLPATLLYYFSFLTHVANLGLLLVYASELAGQGWLGWFRQQRTRAMLAALIALVGLFFHFMLAPSYHFVGPLAVANVLLHYVAPLLYLCWWVIFSPHGGIRFRDIPILLLPPFLYLVWVMARGAIVREYPYAIIDVTSLGYAGAAVNALSVFVGLAVLCAIVVGADRLLSRKPASVQA